MNTVFFVLLILFLLSTIWYLGIFVIRSFCSDKLECYNIRFEVTGCYSTQELRRMAQTKLCEGFNLESLTFDDVLVRGRQVGTVVRGIARQSPEYFFMNWLTGVSQP